jgi:hypothetical protein
MVKRESRPSRCWQRTEKDAQPPEWITFDLDEQSVGVGYWVVMHDDEDPHPYPILLTAEQFEETYR